MTYNVLSLRRGRDRVAAVISAVDPDVVCIQEAPRFWTWAEEAIKLADACGMKTVTGGRPAAANLLLARPSLDVVERRDVKLPWHPPRHRRGVAVATFGNGVTVASTHLSLQDEERLDQARRVVALLRDSPTPVVLGGDVNEEPDGLAWQTLADAWPDAYVTCPVGDGRTSTAANPTRRLDGIFADRRLRVVGCGVPDVPDLADASDHRPLVAEVSVG